MKFFRVYLVLLCRYVNAESFNQLFKKLDNKKISIDSRYYEKSNISQCFNHFKKMPGCAIFNFDSKRHIYQLTVQSIDGNYENAVMVDTW